MTPNDESGRPPEWTEDGQVALEKAGERSEIEALKPIDSARTATEEAESIVPEANLSGSSMPSSPSSHREQPEEDGDQSLPPLKVSEKRLANNAHELTPEALALQDIRHALNVVRRVITGDSIFLNAGLPDEWITALESRQPLGVLTAQELAEVRKTLAGHPGQGGSRWALEMLEQMAGAGYLGAGHTARSEEDLKAEREEKQQEGELRFTSLRDVARAYRKPEWLVRNATLADAFKFTGGAEKTLKSWTMICEAVSVAAGVPLFGNEEFAVPAARPVLVVTGEGGVDLYLDRVRHVCAGLGISFEDVADNLLVTQQVMSFDQPGFGRGLERAIKAVGPALIHIEPLYVYMGATASQNAGNVYAMGPVLAELRDVCAGRAVHIGHHFNKAGRDTLNLSSLTQAGAREFADHWFLLAHREPVDLDRQSFKLIVSAGARRGFGWTRHLDIELGPLNPDTLLHEGVPTFTLAEPSPTGDGEPEVDWRQVVLQEIRDEPGEWTQKELTVERNGVELDSPGKRRAALKFLESSGIVRTVKRSNSHGGRKADRYEPVLNL